MPLVKQHTIERWYRTDSWVYRNFRYLFVNPLWSKSVPEGFSLCPYFWLSLFSLFVFRFFVYAVVVVKLVSTLLRLDSLIDCLDRFVVKFIPSTGNAGRGGPITVLFALLIGFTLCMWIFWLAVLQASFGGAGVPIASSLVLLVTFGVCAIHYSNTRNDLNRTKVEYYVRTVAVLGVVASAIALPNAFFIAFVLFPIKAVILLWDCVSAIVMWAIMGIIKGSIFLMSICFHGIASIWVEMVWGISIIIGVSIMFILFDKYIYCLSGDIKESLDQKNTVTRRKKILADHMWQQMWIDPFDHNKTVKKAQCIRWINFYFNKEVDDYIYLRRKGITVEEASKSMIKTVEDEALRFRTKSLDSSPKNNVLRTALAYISKPFVFIIKEAGTFFVLIWELIKAKKSGACPYIRFNKK